MDKRTFLRILGGKTSSHEKEKRSPSFRQFNNSLNPYTGSWGYQQVVHLLNRAIFGPTKAQIDQSVNMGLEATIQQLFAEQPVPDPPIYFEFEGDINVAIGETWINTPPFPGAGDPLINARRRSLASWMTGLIKNAGWSFQEKMVLFWHEHFPLSGILRSQFSYHYVNILRKNALGNFRTMIEEITINPAMLLFLNGNENTKEAPNENYSRELLELFTIGRGEEAGPGDYTNYTERDVAEMARALTGWEATTFPDGTVGATFNATNHDEGDKQLSHRFDDVVISNEGVDEYKRVIDIILQKEEVARHICRRLHIWLVGSDISAEVEANIIEPMAQLIIDNDYSVQPAVMALLSSEYFFSGAHLGCMINSPIDFFYKVFNTFEITMPDDLFGQYRIWARLFNFAESMDMALMGLPSVAGWKAYYQAPQFYEFWINSVSLNLRSVLTDELLEGHNVFGFVLQMDLIQFIAGLDNPLDPNDLIDEASKIIFVVPLSQNQKDHLKNILIPGLPDFEWTVEYSNFLADPDDPELKMAVETKLKALFRSMLKMPEFYLM